MKSTAVRVLVLALVGGVPLFRPIATGCTYSALRSSERSLPLGCSYSSAWRGCCRWDKPHFTELALTFPQSLTLHFGVPFPIAFLLAGIAAALSSLLLVPIVKLQGSSLAVATLGFNIIIYLVCSTRIGRRAVAMAC